MKSRFLLHCDITHGSFTLTQEGGDKRQVFTELQEAIEYAETLVNEDTPLQLFNEEGKLIVESTVLARCAQAC